MRYLLIILSSFCFVAASAQKIRFTDSTNRWYGVNFDGNGFPYDFVAFFDSDTVINGNTYLYMESWFVGSEIYVREDTVAAKVFVYAPVFFQDTSEHVLYDYSLQLNDTVINTNQQDTDRYYVSMIDSTQINNVWHKVWRLNKITSGLPPYYDVVEGMGCTLAPWFPMYSSTFENTIMLYCFYNNNTKPFIPSPASIPDWYFHNTRLNCYTGIEDINVSSATLVVSPKSFDRNIPVIVR